MHYRIFHARVNNEFFLRGATERNARFKLRDRDYDSSRIIPRPVRKCRDYKILVLRPISNEIQKALIFFSAG